VSLSRGRAFTADAVNCILREVVLYSTHFVDGDEIKAESTYTTRQIPLMTGKFVVSLQL
jgi:hypothetical protein